MMSTNDRARRVARGALAALLGVGALALAASDATANQWHYNLTMLFPTDFTIGAEEFARCNYSMPAGFSNKYALMDAHQVGGGFSHLIVDDSSWIQEKMTGQLAAYSPGINLYYTCTNSSDQFTESRFLPVWAEFSRSAGYTFEERCPASHPWIAAAVCDTQTWW